jgi:hypothetical protein
MDIRRHAFVVMPFGTKTDATGQEIQFNEVHKRLIRPALEKAGLKAFRADEEQRAGDIRADMCQELLLAGLGFRSEVVEPATATLKHVLRRLERGREGSAETWKPDQVLLSAAAGGDLLFLEAALERGATCHGLLPFDEPTFLERSVLPSHDSALACGIAKLRFITLWDGSSGGDGPGGTAHLLRQVKRRTGRVEWIDTRTLKPDGAADDAFSPLPGG